VLGFYRCFFIWFRYETREKTDKVIKFFKKGSFLVSCLSYIQHYEYKQRGSSCVHPSVISYPLFVSEEKQNDSHDLETSIQCHGGDGKQSEITKLIKKSGEWSGQAARAGVQLLTLYEKETHGLEGA